MIKFIHYNDSRQYIQKQIENEKNEKKYNVHENTQKTMEHRDLHVRFT